MQEDTTPYKERYNSFIKTVCQTEVVYGLQSEDAFATMWSNEFEDEEGNHAEVICFWSEVVQAQVCANEDWSNYEAGDMPLSDFMENWCIGLYTDELLLGINMDEAMNGYEAEPLDVLNDLIAELKRIGKELPFKKFKNLQDFENQIKEITE